MVAIFMSSSYQAEFRFASEQTGIVRKIKRVVFRGKPEAGRKPEGCRLSFAKFGETRIEASVAGRAFRRSG